MSEAERDLVATLVRALQACVPALERLLTLLPPGAARTEAETAVTQARRALALAASR